MRSIEARFLKSEIEQPALGAYIHLARAVRNQGFSRRSLMENFKKLMPEDEYDRTDTKALVDYLEELTDELKRLRRFDIFEKYGMDQLPYQSFISEPIDREGGRLAYIEKRSEEYEKQSKIVV